ncbi:MAG: hypothetical protein GY855_00105, partial [candidate division Zixibacteria bacterium]|nr:hypothetical protein [candidate division Zixibacteria bacterium]
MRKSLFIVTIIALFLTANAFGGDINTSNKVQSKHTYNGIQPFDAGGPDAYGYTWKDSNEPDGPVYNWIDITTTGIEIPGLSFDDNVGPAPIGFNFNFYGTDFSTFRMCTNGWFSFTDDTIQYDHVELPSTAAPENIIAPFWNDQAYMFGAKAYYYSNNVDTMIISCHNVRPEAGPHSGPFTYQMILTANGEITFQYLELNDFESWATVGIQNAGRDIGLQIAYDEEYLTDGLAITIYPPPAPQVVYFQDF